MAIFISPETFPEYLTCPFCWSEGTTLVVMKNKVQCKNCKREYPITKHVLEFVRLEDLNKQAKSELKGNSYIRTRKDAEHYAQKDKWSNYYNHFANQKIGNLLTYFGPLRPKGVISLGSGTGYELKEILKGKNLSLVLSSDLSISSTRVVPLTLKENKVKLGLFTSDLYRPPVRSDTHFPIVIYEALHHTADIHMAIQRLLRRNYQNILFVEPATNFVVKLLAWLGLAQRVEYSGLKPEFLDIGILKSLAKKYDYDVKIRTLWHIPEDYFRVICKKNSKMEPLLLVLIDLLSFVGNIFHFGNFAIVSLESRRPPRI